MAESKENPSSDQSARSGVFFGPAGFVPEFFGIQAGKLVGVNEDGTAEFLQLKGIRFDGYQHG